MFSKMINLYDQATFSARKQRSEEAKKGYATQIDKVVFFSCSHWFPGMPMLYVTVNNE